ncbi:uncharacterized protein LOC121339411 [Onychostruthus taczanowskii]|uniref:uncharacterized protein LOC121339411 n=1 Tax=Onychostruthus taczanowskii TaxID=356909 RepID=UPI001B806162|nr:uncharacterized protein LOC121339411 [Onychostruthus taczanowskii]
MSPPGGRRCPPALLALLLGLAGSRGSRECQNRAVSLAVSAGGSLCLAPQEPPREWAEIRWKVKIDSGTWQKILTAPRAGTVSYPKGSFQGRAKFQPGNLSLCISPVHRADSGVYSAEFENAAKISSRCFQVSVWDPIPPPELKSQILQRDRGWCVLALLCSSPGNVSYSWACPGDPPGEIPEQIPEQIPEEIPEEILKQIPEEILEQILKQIPEEIPEQIPGIPSWLIRRLPEGAEPQICLCNVSNPAGWSAARARLTCPEIPENSSHWTLLAVGVAVGVGLPLLLVGSCCWWRKRRKNSREETPRLPAGPSELTVYAEVGEKKPRQDPRSVIPRTLPGPGSQTSGSSQA